MLTISRFILFSAILSIITGPFTDIPLGLTGVHLYLTDLLAASSIVLVLIHLPKIYKTIKKDTVIRAFLMFAGVALLSLCLTPVPVTGYEQIVSFLYLLRYTAYFSFYPLIVYILGGKVKPLFIFRLLSVTGLITAFLGWIQYSFYPDLRNLIYLGWDPHYKRIFSTYFDPNYLGFIFVFLVILLFIVFRKTLLVWICLIFSFLTLAFTYSRSSFTSLAAGILFYSIALRKFLIFFCIVLLFAFVLPLLPRPGGEGVKLERLFSIETRIGNWEQGIQLFSRFPILGVGFNTVRYARRAFYSHDPDLEISHAGAGYDNSFIFVMVTTGIIGLAAYLYFLFRVFLRGGMLLKTSVIAVIIHSMFLNSLFFPWILLWLWIVLAADPAEVISSQIKTKK